jgi:glycosyltransferase involved in cell wall biosynthesis
MSFLFNFIVSPARNLHEIRDLGVDVRILTTNKRFFNELTTKDKHEHVRNLPRMILRSPIDPESVNDYKIISDKIRIGKHSKGMSGKWNEEHIDVIKNVNKEVGDKVIWDFMGMPSSRTKDIKDIPNVITRKEFSLPVCDFLTCIDIFFFFNSWSRQEPWARAMGEGMCAGCAVLANRDSAGNEEQILHGNNGYLFKSSEEATKYLIELVNNPKLIKTMGMNNIIYSREFCSENVIRQLMDFIR